MHRWFWSLMNTWTDGWSEMFLGWRRFGWSTILQFQALVVNWTSYLQAMIQIFTDLLFVPLLNDFDTNRYIEIFRSSLNEIFPEGRRGGGGMGGFPPRPAPYDARDRFGGPNRFRGGGGSGGPCGLMPPGTGPNNLNRGGFRGRVEKYFSISIKVCRNREMTLGP